ncbi:hypothetical protein CE91St41_01260 [Oscillospiraceae bacterium]|nr:hypothetical protein CE91St40_01260 [Oscillospiraceae bacterium]BDF73237.1 hypothetical protein CE91St41_01260 [Oscillospiraceae bacterium]
MGNGGLADKIKRARISAGMTQSEVAQLLEITPQAISNYERGTNRVDVETLTKLCDIYHTSVSDILAVGDEITLFTDGDGNLYTSLSELESISTKDISEYEKHLWEELHIMSNEEAKANIIAHIKRDNITGLELYIAFYLVQGQYEGLLDDLPQQYVIRLLHSKVLLSAQQELMGIFPGDSVGLKKELLKLIDYVEK